MIIITTIHSTCSSFCAYSRHILYSAFVDDIALWRNLIVRFLASCTPRMRNISIHCQTTSFDLVLNIFAKAPRNANSNIRVTCPPPVIPRPRRHWSVAIDPGDWIIDVFLSIVSLSRRRAIDSAHLAITWPEVYRVTAVVIVAYGTKVRRYNWHSAGSTGWPFLMLEYKYVFQKNMSDCLII